MLALRWLATDRAADRLLPGCRSDCDTFSVDDDTVEAQQAHIGEQKFRDLRTWNRSVIGVAGRHASSLSDARSVVSRKVRVNPNSVMIHNQPPAKAAAH